MIEDEREAQSLASEFSDRSRRVKRSGGRFLIPKKFDDDGNPLKEETLDARKHLKSLSLNDLRFLKLWRDSGWNDEEAAKRSLLTDDQAKRMVRRLAWAKVEDERTKALADIPTPAWITAKHTENFFDNKLADGQRDSLKELAKITGSYKATANLNFTQNVFNAPKLSPEAEKEFKALAERILDAEIVRESAA